MLCLTNQHSVSPTESRNTAWAGDSDNKAHLKLSERAQDELKLTHVVLKTEAAGVLADEEQVECNISVACRLHRCRLARKPAVSIHFISSCFTVTSAHLC